MGSKKPIVMERPQRGREMVTREFAIPDNKGKRGTLALHEGYVQDHKFLVPDSDLAAMKELVDYRLGQGPKDRYVRDYEYEHAHLNEDDDKFRKMSERLHSDDSSLSVTTDDESTDDTGEQKKSKHTIRFADEESDTEETKSEEPAKEKDETTKEEDESSTEEDETTTEDATSVSKKSEPEEKSPIQSKSSEPSRYSEKSVSKSSKPSSYSEKSVSKSSKQSSYSVKSVSNRSSSGTTQPLNIQPPIRLDNNDRIHFLLSGHLRSNQIPIFIFHQYTGKSVFESKKPDFISIKNEGDTDLIIQGKFFQDSILEEVNGVPIKLTLKPEKLVIDKRSKIFEDEYCELLHVGTTGVEIGGKFIRQADTKKMTPLLSFNVIHPNKKPTYSKDNESQKPPPTTVYTSTPVTESVFEQKRTKHIELPDDQEFQDDQEIRKREPQRNSSIQRSSVSSRPKDAYTSRSPKRHFKSERNGEEVEEYEPHLKKMPLKVHKKTSISHALIGPVKQKDAAGDVGSTGVLVYNCDVGRRRSSAKESTSVFRKLSQKIFPSR